MGGASKVERYIKVYDWMFNLGMTWNEIIIYALVYGYNSSGENYFASQETTARRLGMQKSNLNRAIGHLVDKGLLRVEKEFEGYYFYYAIRPRSTLPCPNTDLLSL